MLGNPRVLRASLRLTRWLRCRYGIGLRDVIGHNESLSPPLPPRERRALRRQTHGDMARPAMQKYRARFSRLGPCPT